MTPVADSALVAALKRQLAEVEADLRGRSEDPELVWAQGLRAEYAAARERGRTALAWSVWRDGEVALAGVAWVLGAVFVRFVEDNGLVDRVWIAGAGDRMSDAVDAETAFYADDPSRNSRDWLPGPSPPRRWPRWGALGSLARWRRRFPNWSWAVCR